MISHTYTLDMSDKKHLEKVINALGFVADFLNKSQIPWLLGASGALMVHGVDVIPYDLDIFVSKADVIKIEKLLNKYIKNPLHDFTDQTGAYIECQLLINNIEVEILELDELGHPQPVNFHGHTVYVNSLAHELEEYKKKPDKKEIVQLIEKLI